MNLRPNRNAQPCGAWDAKKSALMLALLKARREAADRGKRADAAKVAHVARAQVAHARRAD